MLESLEQSNIKRMSVERSKDVPFDPKRDIRPEEWQAMFAGLDERAASKNVNYYSTLYGFMKEIDPNVEIIPSEEIKKIIEQKREFYTSNFSNSWTYVLSNLRQIWPDLNLEITEKNRFKKNIIENLEILNDDTTAALGYCSQLSTVKKLGLLDLIPEQVNNNERKKWMRECAKKFIKRGEFDYAIDLAAHYKYIYPAEDIEIPDEAFDFIKKGEIARDVDYVESAANASFLMRSKGLVSETPPAPPEQRNF